MKKKSIHLNDICDLVKTPLQNSLIIYRKMNFNEKPERRLKNDDKDDGVDDDYCVEFCVLFVYFFFIKSHPLLYSNDKIHSHTYYVKSKPWFVSNKQEKGWSAAVCVCIHVDLNATIEWMEFGKQISYE